MGGAATMSVDKSRWVLELAEGQWQGDPPPGRLRMQVVGLFRRTVPGFVIVSGWRHLEDRQPPVLPGGGAGRPGAAADEVSNRRNTEWVLNAPPWPPTDRSPG